ncbi:trypsin-like cysteine/serine peptidase domain-containing protein [Mycena galericulata]|nr:trypsin-like cysteine/serine peptidase domain-containing protein [Mycena galericulata]
MSSPIPISPRRTRQRSKQLLASTRSVTHLSRHAHNILLRKRDRLRQCDLVIPKDFNRHASAAAATLVFAQEEAGTAVCVSADGLLLTCSHCVAETEDDVDIGKMHWLIFASGRVVGARCVAWDGRRDLALLRIVAAQGEQEQVTAVPAQPQSSAYAIPVFPHAVLHPSSSSPSIGTRLLCIGHPGSEDLEAAKPGIRTGYDVLHVSTGNFRGLAEGQDPHDNADIGALMHDCWTYWGHSGAPLLDRTTGRLVGLHSSWDEDTGMRRGVSSEAVAAFLDDWRGELK